MKKLIIIAFLLLNASVAMCKESTWDIPIPKVCANAIPDTRQAEVLETKEGLIPVYKCYDSYSNIVTIITHRNGYQEIIIFRRN